MGNHVRVGLASAFLLCACARDARPLDGTSTRQLLVGGVPRTYLLHAGGEAKT
jgi:hypothetical protein